MRNLLSKIIGWILWNQKLALVIALSILFLLVTQTLLGQSTLKTTTLQGNTKDSTICIPIALADTIIHDLEERKILLQQKDLFIAKGKLLEDKVTEFGQKNLELQEELVNLEQQKNKWQTKAAIRGWQRNGFIVAFIASVIVILR